MTVPHLAVPFTFGHDGNAVTVDQNSIDEVAQAVAILCNTPTGSRIELPGYGVPDQTFTQAPDPAPIAAAIATWEPRAAATVTVTAGSRNPKFNVAVAVATQTG